LSALLLIFAIAVAAITLLKFITEERKIEVKKTGKKESLYILQCY
jgi:hypothetical protein